MSTTEKEISELKSKVKRLSHMLVRVTDELQKQDKKTAKAESKLNVKVNKLNRFYSIANPIARLAVFITSFGLFVGLLWQITNPGHWEGHGSDYHYICDWMGSYIFLLFLLFAIVTFSVIYMLKGRYSLPVATAKAEYWSELQIRGQINMKQAIQKMEGVES